MEDLDLKIAEINNRLAASEKRFDDLKGYFAGAAGFFTLWFVVLNVVLSMNYNSEKAALRDFQHDLREDLGKSAPLPQVDLLGVNGKPLAGQTVIPTYRQEDGKLKLVVDYIVKNSGLGTTGPMTAKIYTVDPIELIDKSSDETQFNYEAVIEPKYLDLDIIPGQLSAQWGLDLLLVRQQIPPAGNYPALIKVYYGQGKVAQAPITLACQKREAK